MKHILNLYAGLGGNRHLWPANWKITSVEYDARIAKLYQRQFPKDKVLVEDAHTYLEKNYMHYDAVWTSPPCPTHSRMQRTGKFKKFPSMMLYEEIIFLNDLVKVPYIVENVQPYYQPLIWPKVRSGPHYFWSHKNLEVFEHSRFPGTGIYKFALNKKLDDERSYHHLKYLGLKLTLKELQSVISNPRQMINNCVHPQIGLHLMKQIV